MENQKIIQVEEKVPFKMLLPLSIQHMFAMFGGIRACSVCVRDQPASCTVYERNRNTAIYLDHKGKAPAYLGSSFAFLAPAGVVISKWGIRVCAGWIRWQSDFWAAFWR